MNEFRLSSPDVKCLPLWRDSFGDSEEYILRAITVLKSDALCAALFEGERPVSQCMLIEKRLIGASGLYVYAACTDPERRGMGLFGELIERCAQYAKEQGVAFLSLIPAGSELAEYYKKRGFTERASLSASPYPTSPDDLYRRLEPSVYIPIEFDGDYGRLHAMSDRTLAPSAYRYTCDSLSEICEPIYARLPDGKLGYVIRCRADHSKIFDASFELMQFAVKTVPKNEEAFALIRPTDGSTSFVGIDCADPLPR